MTPPDKLSHLTEQERSLWELCHRTCEPEALADYYNAMDEAVPKLLEQLSSARGELKLAVDNVLALKERAEAAEQERDRLNSAVDELSKEYHAAINEPEYAGTRQDWINRAMTAESRLRDLREKHEKYVNGLKLACFDLAHDICEENAGKDVDMSDPQVQQLADTLEREYITSQILESTKAALLEGQHG